MFSSLKLSLLAAALFFALAAPATLQADEPPPVTLLGAAAPLFLRESLQKLKLELSGRHGEQHRPRIERGIDQVAGFWREEDGDAAEFEAFVREHLVVDPADRDALFGRLEPIFEQVDGHMLEISRQMRRQTDLDLGPILPVDTILAAYEPSAHLVEDFFANRLAFTVLLNFPLTSLEERLEQGEHWTRRQWAEVRLAQRFSKRLPARVNLEVSRAYAETQRYVAEYNIWMHHLLDEQGRRLFPPKLRLISHWNLRDELKAAYSDPEGLPRQRLIQQVMERIVTQTIPRAVIDNPHLDWKPVSNQVQPTAVKDSDRPAPVDLEPSVAPEPDTRYAMLLRMFHAARLVDRFSPTAPTLIARRFDEHRELPEPRVRQMLIDVVSAPQVKQVARQIEKRLGRKLEPFDLWYNGFRPRGQYTEAQLDALVKSRYPSVEAFANDLPRLLMELGFSRERADFLAAHIAVDPSRGAGHALGAARREDKARLRTRVGADGMDYKGFNIAIHELGHNVEQVISLHDVDHFFLAGVPNTAFTEALAFVFQGHDLELLGLTKPDRADRALGTLNDFWATFEIAGVALVDMEVWHWLYDHPEATPGQLKEAVLRISKEVWNRYYAPVLGKNDVVLLGVYSHMIDEMLYLPDYPLGHMIAFQIEEQMGRAGNLSAEVERMARTGCVTPDLWMKQATGALVGPEPLLRATERALKALER